VAREAAKAAGAAGRGVEEAEVLLLVAKQDLEEGWGMRIAHSTRIDALRS
jgi:hypothetical protein